MYRPTISAILFPFYALALFAAMAAWGPSLRTGTAAVRAEYNAGRTDAAMGERNSSAFAQILDEFRSTMADMMFVKTNRYLHGGVAYAPRLRVDSTDESQTYAGCTPGTPTLIRPAGSDFRGLLGELEREVKPFREAGDSHIHMTADELAPWFRMMTLVNPNYIRGYRIGAKTLADDKKWEQALEFLNEGIANNQSNPELFLLYQSLASFHMRGRYQPGYPWGEDWKKNALEAATKAYQLGMQQRPALGAVDAMGRSLRWSADLEEDFRYAAHMIPLLLREEGKINEALAKAQEIQAVAPNYIPLQNTLRALKSTAEAVQRGRVK